jgi:glycine/D-amino acid oxidase-like deaminating enzyme
VAIVGAGFTGLWTAYYLAQSDAARRIVVLEAEEVGFGASGRNGGWCSALFPASLDALAREASRDAALSQHAAMVASVDEVGRVCAAEGIDADFARGGTISLVRSAAQETRARAEVEDARTWGRSDLAWLDAEAAREVLAGDGVRGATYTPHCAALHPLKLARGLARVVTERGVRIHEHTRVTAIEPGRVRTQRGVVRADVIVRATEGYTPTLAGQHRAVAPIYSLIVATEQLGEDLWARIGLARRETFTDHRHLIVYGQRTADDRLVFGGRGAPYHFGSRIRPSYDVEPRVFAGLRSTLLELLPQLDGVRFTHSWGGCLGVPRDWFASVGLDAATGLAWAGGYVGDGVSTTNLAGRTLRDLVETSEPTPLTQLPWVGHRSRAWEPEPLRWLGINAGLRAMSWADREERLSGRPSVLARALGGLLGE